MKIVIFCPNAVGDLVMATPLFRALRLEFPSAHVSAVVRPNSAPTLDGSCWFDELILFHPRSRDKQVGTWSLLRTLRQRKFDTALILPNSFRTALLAWIGGAKRRIGYNRYGRGMLLTDRLAPQLDAAGNLLPSPIVPYYLELAKRLGCRTLSPKLELFTTPADERSANEALAALGIKPGRRIVALNTGGAFGPAKNWPEEHFAVLASRLATELDVDVLVLCGPAEASQARAIAQSAGHPQVVSLADQPLGLGLTKACVKRSALLITTDSGPRHFAAPFGVPVLTLFGPTHIAWTRTHYAHSTHIFHPVPCGPCQRSVCPLGHHHCMKNLHPNDVYSAAVRMLGSEKRPHFPILTSPEHASILHH